MAVHFDELNKNDFMERLRGAADSSDANQQIELNRKLYDGDHWLGGSGWIGPIPATTDKTYNDIKQEIAKVFCSRNVVKEVTDRAVDGLLGREPRRLFTSETKVEKNKLEEASTLALDFWKKRKNLKILKEAMGRQKIGEDVCVRFYVPRGLLIETANGLAFPSGTIEECLDRIHIHVTTPGQAAVTTDEETQREIAIYNEKRSDETEYIEVEYVDAVNPNTTVMRVFNDSSDDEGLRFELQIGGRLTMYEPTVRNIISQQVRENQFAINLAKTMQSHNVITGGFLERIIMDAMPPGKWVPDPDNPGKEMYEVGPFKVGSGTTNFYLAAEYKDNEGNVSHGDPKVYFRDPVTNETFIEAKRDCYQDILEEVSQAHYLMTGDATSSGVSRVQARAAFEAHLNDDKGEIDPLCVWMLETPLAMAAYFAGQPGYFDSVQIEADCYVNTGPLSEEERKAIIEQWEKGLIPTATAMSMIGIDDVAGNIKALINERNEQAKDENISSLAVLEQRATIAQLLSLAGGGVEAAAKIAGFEASQAAELGRSDFVETTDNGKATNGQQAGN